jgi:predicted RNA-binding Zn ribbon-like protein
MTDSTTVCFREGAGRLCLDFLRTLRYRGTPDATEELARPADLAAWVRQCGPCGGASGAVDEEGVREGRALREAVYELVTAAGGPGGPGAASSGARSRVNRAAGEAVPVPRLSPAGELRWYAEDPVRATLAVVARDALDLATSPELLGRLRPCAAASCGALFLDQSRPGTRRWCSMDVCGNRAKKSALRSREG